MLIENLMPQIRAGKTFRLATLHKDIFIRYVEDDIAADRYEYGAIEPYTGFIATQNGTEYLWDMPGDLMFSDGWELCDEPTQSV
ncbi:hypothetical protein [Psychrobacter aquimaris]|uniref:hypothetical protein n=1 Tax=Psychrobacter aquimaris TaxID=292733 RepID=UPI0018DF0F78|nr:hypothetical protein [Psychrobacter aquimaris]